MTWDELGIDISKMRGTQNKTRCPRCNADRKNKRDPSLSVNLIDKTWNCHHCGWHGKLMDKESKKEYTPPVKWTNSTQLSERVVNWFASRKISQQTLLKHKISEGKEWMPQTGKDENTIQFPYYRNRELINVKYRDGAKNFKMAKGAQLIFWNLDSIKNFKDAENNRERDSSKFGVPYIYSDVMVVITEGEIDGLTVDECGISEVVSVPNGASKGNNNLQYLDDCIDAFEGVDKIIIAVDNDAPGIALREELVRRLGAERCYIPDFKDCKDANEFAQGYGLVALNETLLNAKPVPIEGVVEAMEMFAEVIEIYRNGLPSGDSLDIPKTQDDNLDDLIRWYPGQLTMITGSPGSGKSEFLDFVMERLAILRDWKFAVFSPENFPTELHLTKLIEKIMGRPINGRYKMDEEDIKLAMTFIQEHWFTIRPKDENFTLDMILEKAVALVKRKGIRGLVIDPWNYLEHQREGFMSETEYVSAQLSKIVSFKQRYKVAVFVVAHPRKLQKDKNTGLYEPATLYDILGSAHFFNKTDNGISIYRNFQSGEVTSFIQKVKFKWMGKVGHCLWAYDQDNGRYAPLGTSFDKNPHLGEKKVQYHDTTPFKITPNVNAEESVKEVAKEPVQQELGLGSAIYMCAECMDVEVSRPGELCDRCVDF